MKLKIPFYRVNMWNSISNDGVLAAASNANLLTSATNATHPINQRKACTLRPAECIISAISVNLMAKNLNKHILLRLSSRIIVLLYFLLCIHPLVLLTSWCLCMWDARVFFTPLSAPPPQAKGSNLWAWSSTRFHPATVAPSGGFRFWPFSKAPTGTFDPAVFYFVD